MVVARASGARAMAGRPLFHVTPRRPLRAQAAAGGDAAEASGAEPAPRREVRFAEPPPPREGGSFGPTRRGEAAAAGGRGRGRGRRRRRRGGGGAAAGRMVGGSDGQAPPDATELKRRRKSPRLSAARAEEAEAEAAVEPGPGEALEGERRGRARAAPRGGSRGRGRGGAARSGAGGRTRPPPRPPCLRGREAGAARGGGAVPDGPAGNIGVSQ